MSRIEALVATYAGGDRFLQETVDSLREQGIEPKVVMDDRLPHLKWNEAIDNCTADYLALPHHDDIYLPKWSEEMVAYLEAHPSAVAAFCLDYLIDENGKRVGQTYPAWEDKDSYSFKDLFDLTIRHGNVLRCETVVFNRKVLGDMRFPDRSVSGTAHDTQFWFELAAKHPIGIVMKPLVKYRVHPESDTQKTVVGGSKGMDHFKALRYAMGLRPQDVEFIHRIGVSKRLYEMQEVEESVRVRGRESNGAELLVCHEPPDAAGTGVVVAERVRQGNRNADGKIRYYVYPEKRDDIEVMWQDGVPVVKCPPSAFGDIVERFKPEKVEYHHILRWPADILLAPVPTKELWLHDSYLWCARYHSVNKDGVVCNQPEDKKCADCSGEAVLSLSKKREFLAAAVPKMTRVIANSNYTAIYAREHLGVVCELKNPAGAALKMYPLRKRVGYFGGFGVVKGTPTLLKAWPLLKGKAQLLMFCDLPTDWRSGRKLYGYDDVLVMGGYKRGDLPELCNLIDVAVIPSVNESYGLIKRELESLNVPVVATKVGGLEGDVSPNDAVALAKAITRLLDA